MFVRLKKGSFVTFRIFVSALYINTYIYSGTPLNDHPNIPTTFKSPAQLLLIDISINEFQNYDHPEITTIFFGPMGGRNFEVPLYILQ